MCAGVCVCVCGRVYVCVGVCVCVCVCVSEVGLCGFVCLLKTGSKEGRVIIYGVSETIGRGQRLYLQGKGRRL